MLARQFIKTAFETTIQAKVVGIQGKDLAGQHGSVEPLRQRDLDRDHATTGRVLFHNAPFFQESETAAFALTVGDDIRSMRVPSSRRNAPIKRS